jgi:hypothetical protein
MGVRGVTANHPSGVMWPHAQGVRVVGEAMTLEADMPLIAVSVLAWVMIVLPILLFLGIGIAYLVGRRRSADEIETTRDAGMAHAPGPDDVDRGPPGGVTT